MCRSRAMGLAVGAAVLAAFAAASARQPAGVEALRRVFVDPPADARVMMRWWWHGPAVTPAQVERDLQAMKDGGLGGVEVQPVYPLALDEPGGLTNLRYLSDEFLQMLRVASDRAGALGLRFDLTLGSGWPFGGPTVAITDAASRLRFERIDLPAGATRVVQPSMTTGERWIGAFIGPAGPPSASAASMTPLDWQEEHPALAVPAFAQPRQVWAFIAGRTGMQVKRPATGAEGYVLSHYDRAALDRYLEQVGSRLLSPLSGRPPFAIFCDSLEVYESDWAPDFAAEFARRRGYDLAPLLPRLVGDAGDEGAVLREDWGQTLTELLDERFIRPLGEWARARGTRLRMQGYGIPPATVSSNAAVDLPEGEGHPWRELTASRWASSAAHLYDKPVATSETWTWLHSPAFRATPLDIKAEADRHFLQGITQLVGHGWPSTPDGQAYPGWRFYAAGVFNDSNPWWIAMPDIAKYLQRVSAVLRLGRPGNDVALYLPVHDGYAHASPGKIHLLDLVRERMGKEVIASILDAGYGFDLVDDGALSRAEAVDGGILPVGMGRYRAVVVPAVTAMPAATLAALERFAAAGGAVVAVGKAPVRPPGRTGLQARAEFSARVTGLFSAPGGRARVVPDAGPSLRAALNTLVPPPIRIAVDAGMAGAAASAVPSEIGVVERRVDGRSIFFVANTANSARRLRVGLGAAGQAIEWWHPMTGQHAPLAADERGDVTIALAPYESRFLVATGERGRGVSSDEDWLEPAATGPTRVLGPWQVRAGGESWRQDGDAMHGWDGRDALRHFSGVATYQTTLAMTARELHGQRTWLDFGDGTMVEERPRRNGYRAWLDGPVREAAVVEVNGQRVGSVWAPPYQLEITEALRPGANTVRILVGNTAMNHMSGRALPDHRLLNLRYGERFVPQDMDQVEALPSGLTRPVRVVTGR